MTTHAIIEPGEIRIGAEDPMINARRHGEGNMNDEDHVFMRVLPRSVIGLVLTLLLLFFMADMFSRAYDLTWFPWQINRLYSEVVDRRNHLASDHVGHGAQDRMAVVIEADREQFVLIELIHADLSASQSLPCPVA